MAATHEKDEKVVVERGYLLRLEDDQTALLHLLTGLRHYRANIDDRVKKCLSVAHQDSLITRETNKALGILQNRPLPLIEYGTRFEPYTPPTGAPETLHELEAAKAELEMLKKECLIPNAKSVHSLLMNKLCNTQGSAYDTSHNEILNATAFIAYLARVQQNKK